MKELRILLMLSFVCFGASILFAQSGFTYQAVVRHPNNNLVTNSQVQIEISILEGSMTGSTAYQETHTKMTNEAGLVTLEIGSVMPTAFNTIEWETTDHYLKQRINPDPINMPGNYTIESTTKLLSVPYAKYAEKAGRAAMADAIVDNGSGMDAFRMPVGSVIPFAGDVAPDGWFICDGRLLDQTQYADLHTVIGTTYGGAGSDFRIPDLRGRQPIGKGNGQFSALGNSGGQEERTLTENELPAHAHGIDGVTTEDAGAHRHLVVSQGGPGVANSIAQILTGNGNENYFLLTGLGDANFGQSSEAGNHSHSINGESTENTGGGNAFSVLDPYIVLNYIIKY
jgi:microcystin-dependent protein